MSSIEAILVFLFLSAGWYFSEFVNYGKYLDGRSFKIPNAGKTWLGNFAACVIWNLSILNIISWCKVWF